MIFSGVLYLLIAIAYGPLLGTLTATLAMIRTVWLMGNGYSVAFAILESAVIGYLTRRRVAPPIAAVLFWICLGLPLLAFTIFVALHIQTSGWANVMKRALNGFINVIVADLLLAVPIVSDSLFKDRPQRRSVPLRELISTSLLLVSMLPIVIISIAHARSNTRLKETEAKERIQAVANVMKLQIDEHVRKHVDAVASLASAISLRQPIRPDALSRLLNENHKINTGFLTMLVADARGDIIGASPVLSGHQNISDRDYFTSPLRSGTPFVSKIFVGRGFGHDPIIAISAPWRARDGKVTGIVEGSLDLRQFEHVEETHRNLPGTEVVISDQGNRIIYASAGLPYHVLDQAPPFYSGKDAENERSLLDPAIRVREPGYLIRSARSELTGWRVSAQQSLQPLQQSTEDYYLRTLAWLFVAAVLSYLLASLIARRITSPLEELVHSLKDFRVGDPWRVSRRAAYSVPTELLGIHQYLADLAARLAESYRNMREALEEKEVLNAELKTLAAELDRKVQERTVELSVATARAQDANNAKSLFLASMSHEIRTPLNAVIGMTDLLAASDLPAEQLSVAETIRTSAHSLLVLINDILDFTKIESGKLQLEQVRFDLRQVLEDVTAMVAPDAHAKRIELICRTARDVPFGLVGDPNRVQQIIMNLAGNAVKFTSTGEVLIDARLESKINGVAHLRFEVSDTGIGIAPEIQAHLFQPFTQADVSTTREFGGTGLGLAVSRRLVELMHGYIGVRSRLGSGSTFWLDLPLAIADEEPQTPALIKDAILIVDNNEAAGAAMQENLAALNIRSDLANDTESALHMLIDAHRAGRPYAASILDYDLSLVDGVSCESAIHSLPDFTSFPVVLLRPHTGRIHVPQASFIRSLKKPASGMQILDALLSLTTQTRSEDMLPAGNGASPAEPVRHQHKILLVEDNPINQRVALRMLSKLGYDADLASDGLMAIRAADSEHYDAILMDCQMPLMDGFEAAREIRRRSKGLPPKVIIALTANAYPEDRERCRRAGMDDYIAKPVALETLRATLDKWIKPQRSHDAN